MRASSLFFSQTCVVPGPLRGVRRPLSRRQHAQHIAGPRMTTIARRPLKIDQPSSTTTSSPLSMTPSPSPPTPAFESRRLDEIWKELLQADYDHHNADTFRKAIESVLTGSYQRGDTRQSLKTPPEAHVPEPKPNHSKPALAIRCGIVESGNRVVGCLHSYWTYVSRQSRRKFWLSFNFTFAHVSSAHTFFFRYIRSSLPHALDYLICLYSITVICFHPNSRHTELRQGRVQVSPRFFYRNTVY